MHPGQNDPDESNEQMAFWLLKTEPSTYSFANLIRERQTCWDGVRNPTALQHIRSMRPSDRCVIYHSGTERAAVGLASVATEPYADPRAGDPKLMVVNITSPRQLPHPVSLASLRTDPRFADSPLVRISRLSVVPLTQAQYHAIAGEC